MKLLRAAVIVLLLMSSSAAADSLYFGVRFDAPIYFDSVGQPLNIYVDPMLGVQFGWDSDSISSGFGLRGSFSTRFVSGVRFALDGYTRSPVADSPALSSYFGAGATALADPGFVVYLNAHLLAGLEYQVSSVIGLFIEISPGAALGFDRFSCVNGQVFSASQVVQPSSIAQPPCNFFIPFTLEAAMGLNFRF